MPRRRLPPSVRLRRAICGLLRGDWLIPLKHSDRNAYKQISPLVLGFGEKKSVQSCNPGLDGHTIYEALREFKEYPTSWNRFFVLTIEDTEVARAVIRLYKLSIRASEEGAV